MVLTLYKEGQPCECLCLSHPWVGIKEKQEVGVVTIRKDDRESFMLARTLVCSYEKYPWK